MPREKCLREVRVRPSLRVAHEALFRGDRLGHRLLGLVDDVLHRTNQSARLLVLLIGLEIVGPAGGGHPRMQQRRLLVEVIEDVPENNEELLCRLSISERSP